MADKNKVQTAPDVAAESTEKVARRPQRRRTPEERIADFEAKIEAEKSRAKAKQQKQLDGLRERYARALERSEKEQLKVNELLGQIVDLEQTMADEQAKQA